MKTLVLLLYLLRPDTLVVEETMLVEIHAEGHAQQREEPRISPLYWSTCDGWAQQELEKLREQGLIRGRRRDTLYRILTCENTV